jgi:NAD-dependent SIR2 family protein deacetylase
VICNDCRKRFQIEPQQRTLEDGGEEHLFSCPECGREYLMAHITARGVELRKRLAEVRERLQTAAGEERVKLLRQFDQLQWELEPEVTRPEGP